ncbi:MAG: 3-oxoacyl-ACP reductase FabG [Bacteroidia bacterium]
MSKHILLTGAAGNLGMAAVQRLLDDGHRLTASILHGQEAAFADLPTVQTIEADLSNEQHTAAAIDAVLAAQGRIDAAVMIVGGFAVGDIAVTDGALIRKMFALNFETAYYVVRPLLAHMQAQGGGQLIFVGARPALRPDQGQHTVAYALSKGLVFHLAEIINAGTPTHHVQASVVVPSIIDTPQNRAAMPEARFADWIKAEDIAEAIAFLCSDTGSKLRHAVLQVYNEA